MFCVRSTKKTEGTGEQSDEHRSKPNPQVLQRLKRGSHARVFDKLDKFHRQLAKLSKKQEPSITRREKEQLSLPTEKSWESDGVSSKFHSTQEMRRGARARAGKSSTAEKLFSLSTETTRFQSESGQGFSQHLKI